MLFCTWNGEALEFKDLEYSQLQYRIRYIIGYLKAKSHVLNYLHRVYLNFSGEYIFLPDLLNKTFSYDPPEGHDLRDSVRESETEIQEYIDGIESPEILLEDDIHQLLYAIFKEFVLGNNILNINN